MAVVGVDFGNLNCYISVARAGGIEICCSYCGVRDMDGNSKAEQTATELSGMEVSEDHPEQTVQELTAVDDISAQGEPTSVELNKPESAGGGRLALPASTRRWQVFILLAILVAIPVFVFVLLFSDIGIGADVHEYLTDHAVLSDIFLAVAIIDLLLLYILDFSYWEGIWTYVKSVGIGVAVFGIGMACLFAAEKYPAAPMCLYVVGTPCLFVVVRKFLVPKVSGDDFYFLMSVSLIGVGIITQIVFIIWISAKDHNLWPGSQGRLQREFNLKMGCACQPVTVAINGTDQLCILSDLEEYVDCCQNFPCLAGFLLWFSPFIASVVSIVFGLLSYFLSRTLATDKDGIHPGLKVFGLTLMVTILGMWVAASVAGAGMQLSNAVLMLSFVSVALIGAAVVSAVGWQPLKDMFLSIPLVRKILGSFLSDWIRALFMITAFPLFLIYLFASTLNQVFRKKFHCTKDLETEEEESLYLTLVSHQQLTAMRSWAWSSVLVKVMYWGLIFLVLSVGISKITTLFLSWLNEFLIENFEIAEVTAIFAFVGLTMFLLPPVPGVPVYITGGIVLVNSGRKDFGFFGAVFYASVVCFFIKLTAIVGQQKGIGQFMSGSAKIRYMVGTNTITIQAIRMILERPGLNMAKVAILCGGPDWPTSVLTGILELSVFQMLFASCPVYFLILPCVSAGAFLLRANDDGPWGALAPVTVSVAALVQTISMISALYFIENEAEKYTKELEKRCLEDEDVVALGEKEKVIQEKYKEATDWNKAPNGVKFVLVLGSFTLALSCWIVQLNGSLCFRDFEITDSIDEKLDGNPFNLVRTVGWFAMTLLLVGVILLYGFRWWAARAVKPLLAPGENVAVNPVSEIIGGTGAAAETVL